MFRYKIIIYYDIGLIPEQILHSLKNCSDTRTDLAFITKLFRYQNDVFGLSMFVLTGAAKFTPTISKEQILSVFWNLSISKNYFTRNWKVWQMIRKHLLWTQIRRLQKYLFIHIFFRFFPPRFLFFWGLRNCFRKKFYLNPHLYLRSFQTLNFSRLNSRS